MSGGSRRGRRPGSTGREPRSSDARPLDDLERPDPEAERRRRRRLRAWAGGLGAVFVLGSALAVFGERGALDVWRSRRQLQRMERELRDRVERTRRLRLEVERLRDQPTATERLAREQLNLVREGEVLLLLPSGGEPDGPDSPEEPYR